MKLKRVFVLPFFIATIIGAQTVSSAQAGERKFACYFKASGAGNGAYVNIWASSKDEAYSKTIAYLKKTKGSNVRIYSINCRG